MATKAAVLLCLVAAVAAGPLPDSSSHECRKSCPLSQTNKYQYDAGHTYHYDYETESSVQVNQIQGKQVKLRWAAQVDLQFESPCQVVLQIKNPRIEGAANPSFSDQLTRSPLRAVMVDGTFEAVCSERSDDTAAVNIKKGILSALQNSLPSNASLNNGIKITETDVLGVCPTVYQIRKESQKTVVEKSKDHRLCSKRVGGTSESELSGVPIKSPTLMIQSKSDCKQEIEDGLVRIVECKDVNEVSPMPGTSKTVLAHQTSTLKLNSISPSTTTPADFDETKESNLIYDMAYTPNDSSQNQILELQLKEFCTKFDQEGIKSETAQMFTNIVHTMDRVEQSFIATALQKIRQGSICKQTEKLEDLYLDAVRSTINPGAIQVMVNEIKQGRRVVLYTWRLHTIPRVCRLCVQDVEPLFEDDSLPISVTLAAGSIVNRHCATEKNCVTGQPIVKIMSLVAGKIQQSCEQSSSDDKHYKVAFAQLKSVANMKTVTSKLWSAVHECFKQPRAALAVRLAAAEALRVLPCNQQGTDTLLRSAKQEGLNSELRIYAYKASVECADDYQLGSLIETATKTQDDNVHSYLLSHLRNLQQSKAPYKLDVIHRLARFNISQEFSSESMHTSRNYDVSDFSESKAFGSELLNDIIYSENGNYPNEIRSKLTLDLFNQIIPVGEIGLRLENLPALLRSAVGQNSLLGKTSIGKVLKGLIQTLPESSETVELGMFFKSLGQEIMYKSIKNIDETERDILSELLDIISDLYNDFKNGLQLQTHHGLNLRYDLHVSTIQGTPLMITHDLTAVTDINIMPDRTASALRVSPVLSAVANHYVGYKFGPSVGLETKSNLYTSSAAVFSANIQLPMKMTLKVDLPEDELDLFKFSTHTRLIRQIPDGQDQIIPDSQKDPRDQSHFCSKTAAGLKFCCDIDLSDNMRENDSPLVKPSSVTCKLDKEVSSMKGFVVNFEKMGSTSGYRFKFDVPGTPIPTKMDLEIQYDKKSSEHTFKVNSNIMEQPSKLKLVYDADTSSGKKYLLEVFSGSQQLEKIFSAKMEETQESEIKVDIKTLNSLKSILLTDIEVDAAMSPRSTDLPIKEALQAFRLNKCEIVFGAAGYHSQNYIRYSHSQASSQYDGQMQLTKQGKNIWQLKVSSDLQNQDGIQMTNKFTLDYKDTVLAAMLGLSISDQRKQISLQILRNGHENVFSLSSSDIKEQSTSSRNTVILLDMPSKKISLKVSSHLKPISDQQMWEFLIMSNSEEMFSIRGPISGSCTEEGLHQKSQLGIRYGRGGINYHFDTEIDMTTEKNYAKVILNKESELVISYLHDVRPSSDDFSIISKIEVPSVLKTNIDFKKTPSNIHSDTEIMLEVYSPCHIQTQVELNSRDFSTGDLSAKILWDKSRDPEKKIELTGTYTLAEDNHLTIQGEASYQRERYHYSLSQFLKHSDSWSEIDKHTSVEIMKGTEEYFKFKSNHRVEFDKGNSIQIDSELFLMTPHRNEYSLRKQIRARNTPSDLELKQDLTLHSSKSGQIHVALLSSKNKKDGDIDIQVRVEKVGIHEHQPNFRLVGNGQIEDDLENINIDVTIVRDGQKVELNARENRQRQMTTFSVRENDHQLLSGTVRRNGGHDVVAEIHMPDRSLGIEWQYNKQDKFIRIYPNKIKLDDKIEIRSKEETTGEGRNFILSLMYPHSNRQKSIMLSFLLNTDKVEGQMALDVSSTSSNVLKLKIVGSKLESKVFRLETSVFSHQSEGPKLTVDIASTDESKSLEAFYKKDEHAASSLLFSTKYTKQSDSNGVISLFMKTPQKTFELGGVITEENTHGCQGYKLNTAMEALDGNKYVAEVQTCSPLFIKVTTGVKGETDRYITSIGLKSFSHAEISLVKTYEVTASDWWHRWTGSNKERSETPSVTLSAKLITPTTLSLRAQYNGTTLDETMTNLKEDLKRVSQTTQALICDAAGKVKGDIKQSLPDLADVVDSISEQLQAVKNLQVIEDVTQFCVQKYSKAQKVIHGLVQLVKQMFIELKSKLEDAINSMKNNSKEALKKLQEFVAAALKKLEELVGPFDKLHDKPSRIVQYLTSKMMGTALYMTVDAWVKKQCECYHAQCEEAWSSVAQFQARFLQDLTNASKLLLQDQSVQYARSVLRRYADMFEQKQYFKLVQSAVIAVSKQNIGVFMEPTGVTVNLPLRQPTTNILSAPMHIGLEQPQPMIRMKIDVLELTTTTRSSIKLPKSRCEYYLSKSYFNRDPTVTFSRPGYDDFALKITDKSHSVIVNPVTNVVTVDGKVITEDEVVELVPGEFIVIHKGGMVLSTTPTIVWSYTHFNDVSLIMSPPSAKLTGVGWLGFEFGLQEDEILNIIDAYKVDGNCKP